MDRDDFNSLSPSQPNDSTQHMHSEKRHGDSHESMDQLNTTEIAIGELATQLLDELSSLPPAERNSHVEAFLQIHAGHAEGIRQILASLECIAPEFVCQEAALMREMPQRERSLATQHRVGNYQIVREIGRGGMSIVYEAVDCENERPVALKVLSSMAALDQRRLRLATRTYRRHLRSRRGRRKQLHRDAVYRWPNAGRVFGAPEARSPTKRAR
jgi:hypothetical protein